MNDEQLEQNLRNLPAPELPVGWRAEILAAARHESRAPERENRPALFLFLRNLVARNPYSSGALTALWLLIFLFKATTPIDQSEQDMLAHLDPTKPVYMVDLATEIRLAEMLENPAKKTGPHSMITTRSLLPRSQTPFGNGPADGGIVSAILLPGIFNRREMEFRGLQETFPNGVWERGRREE